MVIHKFWNFKQIFLTPAATQTFHVGTNSRTHQHSLTQFFDVQGVIYQHVFVNPSKTKIIAVYYVQVLKSIQKHINKKKQEIARLCILHQDNARPHVASIGRDFLEKHEIPTVPHPPYNPDLTPCDFWLFPSQKKALRGRQFSSNQEVVTVSQTFFNSLSQADFEKTIVTNG